MSPAMLLLLAAQATEEGSPLNGHFVQVDEAEAQASIDAGVERVVAELNILLRPLARAYLRRVTRYCSEPVIRIEGRTLDYACGEAQLMTAELDGKPFSWGLKGEEDAYTARLSQPDERTLVMFFENDLGSRTNTFQADEDGASLTLSASLEGDLLPVPLSFSMRYRRR